MKTKAVVMILFLLSQILMVNTAFSETARTYQNCSTSAYNDGGCQGTMTSCIELSDRNSDGCYDHYKQWGVFEGNCNGAPITIPIPPTEGDFKYRASDGSGYFNDNPTLDPKANEIVYAVSYYPPLNPQDTSEKPTEIQITFVDSTSLDIVGVFIKLESDSIPLYTSYKVGGNAKYGLGPDGNSAQNNGASIEISIPIMVSPNPANDHIAVSTTLDLDYFSKYWSTFDYLKIYNINGKVVYEQYNIPIRELPTINVQELPAGHYTLEVNTGVIKGNTMFIISR
ncbi:MAG TPA: hypothetical protein DCW42_01195 [Bacteroidetes bacterium]|nr:hypothetical protein [Bacteroidota bacterium]